MAPVNALPPPLSVQTNGINPASGLPTPPISPTKKRARGYTRESVRQITGHYNKPGPKIGSRNKPKEVRDAEKLKPKHPAPGRPPGSANKKTLAKRAAAALAMGNLPNLSLGHQVPNPVTNQPAQLSGPPSGYHQAVNPGELPAPGVVHSATYHTDQPHGHYQSNQPAASWVGHPGTNQAGQHYGYYPPNQLAGFGVTNQAAYQAGQAMPPLTANPVGYGPYPFYHSGASGLSYPAANQAAFPFDGHDMARQDSGYESLFSADNYGAGLTEPAGFEEPFANMGNGPTNAAGFVDIQRDEFVVNEVSGQATWPVERPRPMEEQAAVVEGSRPVEEHAAATVEGNVPVEGLAEGLWDADVLELFGVSTWNAGF